MEGEPKRALAAGFGTLALCVAACGPQPSGDGDADAQVSDPQCVPGHDPNAPVLELVELYAHRPLALRVSGGPVGEILDYVLSTSPVMLAFESLDDEERATLALGTATKDDAIYEFDPALPPPALAVVRIDGTTFHSNPEDRILRGQPPGVKEPVELRLRDAFVAGEFTTPERCSIGQPKPTPGWRSGATLHAAISVAEARETVILYGLEEYDLCQILSGILAFHGNDTKCEDRDPSKWPYQPDATLPDGEGGQEPAWTVDADLAATAVRMVGRAR